MFRNLLTPLTSKFTFPTTTLDNQETIEEEPLVSPEDVVCDARKEEMRVVLEDVKTVPVGDLSRLFQVSL